MDVPRANRRITALEGAVYRRFPAAQRAVRTRQYYRELVAGWCSTPDSSNRSPRPGCACRSRTPELRAKLTPDYRMGCERIIVTDDFHPFLTQANVSVINDRVTEIRASSVVTADGSEYEIDTLILGTGLIPGDARG